MSRLQIFLLLLVFSILPEGIAALGSWSRRGAGGAKQPDRQRDEGMRHHVQNDDDGSSTHPTSTDEPAIANKYSRYYDPEVKRMLPSEPTSSFGTLSVGESVCFVSRSLKSVFDENLDAPALTH